MSPDPPTTSRHRAPGRSLRRGLAALTLLSAAVALVGCPGRSTIFFDEGPGQASDRASGKAPAGTLAACKVRDSKRPPLVNPVLWPHLKVCTSRTPRRYLRLGYSRVEGKGAPDVDAERRLRSMLEGVKLGMTDAKGNVKLLGAVRALHQEALHVPALSNRVERNSARLQACDYARFLNTADARRKQGDDACPVYAYDPSMRRETCLFDTQLPAAMWLTSGWECVAFTDTVGEGGSCHRMCSYDDYCTAQAGCTASDFSLIMCALGVCLPDKVAGLL